MKTAKDAALDLIAIMTMDHISKDAIIYKPSELRLKIDQVLESFAKERAREAFIAGANAIGTGVKEIIERKADEFIKKQPL